MNADHLQNSFESERNLSQSEIQAAKTRVESAERERAQALKEKDDVQIRETQVIDTLKEELRSIRTLANTQLQQMQSQQSLSQDQVSRNAQTLLKQ